MAAPVLQSYSAGTYVQDGGSCVVTKPTGLSVGDMMCASAVSHADSGTAPTITPPAGWSTYTSYTDESFVKQWVFYKVADSSDAAASNFTFTSSGGTNTRIQVGIARISGAPTSLATGSATGHITTPAGASTFTISLDLTYNDVLLLFHIVGRDSSSTRTFSGYTVSGTNPTWTEQADTTDNDSVDTSCAVATASIASPRTLTSIEATASGSLEDTYMILIAIPAQADVAGSAALHTASPSFFDPVASAGTTGSNALLSVSPTFFTEDAVGSEPTTWTPVTKS